MSIRRLAGGYAWRDELEAMRDRSDRLQRGLLALSKRSVSKEVMDEIVALEVVQMTLTALRQERGRLTQDKPRY